MIKSIKNLLKIIRLNKKEEINSVGCILVTRIFYRNGLNIDSWDYLSAH